MIKERDEQVIEFITKLPCYSNIISYLFYPSQRVANRRLQFLADYNYIKRTRHGASDRYFYYFDKEPSQKRHLDYMARAYIWILKNGYLIHDFTSQKQSGKLRPDLLLQVERIKDNKKGELAVEVELSNNNIDNKIKRYEKSGINSLLLVSRKEQQSKILKITNISLDSLKNIV